MRWGVSTGVWRQWVACLGCSLWGNVTMASVIAFNTILVSQLQKEEEEGALVITFEEASWISSLWALASVLGCLIGSLLSDLLGRRRALVLSTLPFTASYLIMYFSSSLASVLASRALAGLGDGIMYPIIPVYVSETMSKELRSSMNNVTNISQNLGLVVVYLAALGLRWRELALLLTLAPLTAAICLLPLPESPYWLARQGRGEEAATSLSWLRGGECGAELAEIIEVCTSKGKEEEEEEEEGVWRRLVRRVRLILSPTFLKPLRVAAPLYLMYACSGFSLVGFYLVTVLEEAEVSLPPLQASLLLVTWRLLLSMVSSVLLLRVPRRPLYLWTTLLVALSLACLGLHSLLSHLLPPLPWVPILLVGLMFAGAQLGFSPVIKIIVSEVFPTSLRSLGSSLVFLCGSVSIALLAKLFAQFLTWFGFGGTLLLYSCVSLAALAYGYYYVPDYASVSLAAIEKRGQQ